VAERRWGSTLAVAAAAVAVGAAVRRRRDAGHRPGSAYFAGAPLLCAHRGGARLAPENTILAFERAIGWWSADMLELDVQPTRDGEAVVFHDATLERTTDGAGPVAEQSLARMRELDAGFRFSPDGGRSYPFRGRGIAVPTLAEVLAACPTVRVNIEIKDGRAQERVWEVIREAGATDRVLIAAGRLRDRLAVSHYPVPVSASEDQIRAFYLQSRLGLPTLYRPRVDALQIPDRWDGRQVCTPEVVRAAHAINVPVHVWTVDDVDAMHRLLDWGVDGIMSDRPDRLARVLHQRTGRPLPPGPPDTPPEVFLEPLLRG
jgi:glycerophosphoryl diester phosphodiesterase